MPHVTIGRSADLLVVAPATADLLARAAYGLADDLLTATLLTARCPVLYAPALHTEMWEHPATRANVAILRARGAIVAEPGVGRLTGADSGRGRLPEPAELFALCSQLLAGRGTPDLLGRRVVVSAGGTREALDPVRFLGNRSSGRQGYALARTAVARGAEVTLVAANVTLPDPAGVTVVPVVSAADLHEAMLAAAAGADAVVMAAAVADFRPQSSAAEKLVREGSGGIELRLEATEDILAGLAERRSPDQVLVGFAAEHGGDFLERARAKLERKGLDAIVVNDVSDSAIGFDSPDNEVTLIERDGARTLPRGSKDAVAAAILDQVKPSR